MKKGCAGLLLVAMLFLFGFGVNILALGQGNDTICESCPMTVGPEAKEHLKVTDADGGIHYVCCIGCALKTLKTYDSIHIETYCDWYGPDYPIIADISDHGNVTSVDPQTALLLMGGGCTGNRVACNQTAADALLANGFSEYTMLMMQQALPANTNVTTIPSRAMTFAVTSAEETEPPSYLLVALIAAVGIILIFAAVVAYKRLK